MIVKELEPEVDLVLIDHGNPATRQKELQALAMLGLHRDLLFERHHDVEVRLLDMIGLVDEEVLELGMVLDLGAQLHGNVVVSVKFITQPSRGNNGQRLSEQSIEDGVVRFQNTHPRIVS